MISMCSGAAPKSSRGTRAGLRATRCNSPDATLADKVSRALQGGATAALGVEESRARTAMLDRLDESVRACTAELVVLHGLTGTASEDILRQVTTGFETQRAPDADKASLWGGLVTGALGGLAADVAAGGLTFGAGAVLGGIAGALGARKLTQRYNEERGLAGGTVRWSDEFLEARLGAAIIRYLAVAHFGRGRGEFAASDPAPRWQAVVAAALAQRAAERAGLWAELRTAGRVECPPRIDGPGPAGGDVDPIVSGARGILSRQARVDGAGPVSRGLSGSAPRSSRRCRP